MTVIASNSKNSLIHSPENQPDRSNSPAPNIACNNHIKYRLKEVRTKTTSSRQKRFKASKHLEEAGLQATSPSTSRPLPPGWDRLLVLVLLPLLPPLLLPLLLLIHFLLPLLLIA